MMNTYTRTLDQIDEALLSMRQSLARSDALLAELNEVDLSTFNMSVSEPMFSDITYVESDDRRVTFDDYEYMIDEEEDEDDSSRRLSFSSSASTVTYFTPFENREFDIDDPGSESDSDTVVGEWEEPYRSPEDRFLYRG